MEGGKKMLRLVYLHTADLPAEVPELSAFRREKQEQCRTKQSLLRCMGAGVALDFALQTVGLREKDMVYALGTHGKPEFQNHPELHFNLSHSGAWVLCALADCAVGCDVEQIRPLKAAVAERFFAPQEMRILNAASASERELLFFRLWTLKESFVKASGEGLHRPFSSFSVPLTAPISVENRFLTELQQMRPQACAACCTMEPQEEISVMRYHIK